MALGALAGGLISGGASLISGLLSPKKSQSAAQKSIAKSNIKRVIVKNKQEEAWNKQVQARADKAAKVPIVTKTTTSGDVDYKGMMAAAEKSGFNPVTFLNAGGLQAYSRTSSKQTVTGSTAMDAALVGLQKPAYAYYERETGAPQQSGMTIGEAVGSGLTAGVNSFLSIQQTADNNQFQMDMLKASLAGHAANGKVGRALSFYAPATGGVNSGRHTGYAPGDAAPNAPLVDGASQAGNPSGTDLNVSGTKWHFPGPDAQVIEDILGESEIISGIYGVGRAAASLWHPANWNTVYQGGKSVIVNNPPTGFSTWGDYAKSWEIGKQSGRSRPGAPARVSGGSGLRQGAN